MDFSFLVDLLGGGAIGGALGVIAPLFANAQKRKQKAQDDKHELEVQKLGLEELKLSQSHQLLVADKQIDIAENETAGEISLGELKIDLANVNAQANLKGAIAWVRPILTGFTLVALTAFTGWILFEIGGLEEFETSELVDIFRTLIVALITLTNAGFLYWFTARQISKG